MRRTKVFAIPATFIVVVMICMASAAVFAVLQGLIPSLYLLFKICNILVGAFVGFRIYRIYGWVKGD